MEKLREQYAGTPHTWPKPIVDEGVDFQEMGMIPGVSHPENNPFSHEKKELGKMLFFDPRLSKSGQIACASCHDSELGWGDGKKLAFGHNRSMGKRNSMTILNTAFNNKFFCNTF